MIERYSHDTERRNGTTICECGARKATSCEACPACTFQDGTRENAQIIDVLRGTDGLSAPEVARMLGNTYTEGTARSLRRLLRIGRVRRYWRDASSVDGTFMCFGAKVTGSRVFGNGCWVYALDARYVERVQVERRVPVLGDAYLRKKKLRMKRASEGKCTECNNPAANGLTICDEHRRRKAKRYLRKTEAKAA